MGIINFLKERKERKQKERQKEREETILKYANQLILNNKINNVPSGYFKCYNCGLIKDLKELGGLAYAGILDGKVYITFSCLKCFKGVNILEYIKEDLIKKIKEISPKESKSKENRLELLKRDEMEARNIGEALKNPEVSKEFSEKMEILFEGIKKAKVDMNYIKEQAKEHPERMIHQDIKTPEEFKIRNYALHYSLRREFKKAIEYCDKGIKINPKSAYLFYMRGRSKGDIGQFEEGINDLTKAIKLKPKFDDAFIERGYIQQKMGKTADAEEDYKKARKINPYIALPKK